MEKLNALDLFSGIGGNTLALGEWINTVAYCEQDDYAQRVLLSRMSDGLIPSRPIWNDVTTLTGAALPRVDIIVGGFPCQDISVAGHGAGLEGKRSGLFYEIVRLTEETRASFVFLENVPAIRTRGLREVVRAFTELGYDCRWTCVSAAQVGAVHIRKRWFFLAHSNGVRLREECRTEVGRHHTERTGPMVSNSPGSQGRTPSTPTRLSKPSVDRTGDGLPNRLDRHRCLGNAVVPAQAREAFKILMGLP